MHLSSYRPDGQVKCHCTYANSSQFLWDEWLSSLSIFQYRARLPENLNACAAVCALPAVVLNACSHGPLMDLVEKYTVKARSVSWATGPPYRMPSTLCAALRSHATQASLLQPFLSEFQKPLGCLMLSTGPLAWEPLAVTDQSLESFHPLEHAA